MTTRPTSGGLSGVAARAGYAALPPAELLGRYLDARDEAAFRELVERYAGLVGRQVRAVLGRDDLARDAFQETFLRLVRHGHAVRRRDGLAGWLARVARTVALNVRRREARHRRHAMAAATETRPEPREPVPADEAARLRAALAGLPDRYRLPLELVYLDGLTHAEAAARLGLPKGTVDANVSRGLKRLRAALGPKLTGLAVAAALPTAAGARSVPADWVEATIRAAATVAPRAAGLAGSVAAWWTTRPMGALAWAGAVGLVTCGTVWAALTAVPRREPEPPPAPALPPAPEPEPLTVRNKRVLETDVLPKVTAALKPLALNGGDVAVTRVEAHDFRAIAQVELRHRDAPAGVGSTRLRFLMDTRNGGVMVWVDPWGRGEFRALDADRPLVLLRVPELGIDLTLRSEPLDRARAVLRTFPPDPRAAAAAAAHAARVDAALAPYRGTWRWRGEEAHRVPFAPARVTGPDDPILVPALVGTTAATAVQLVVEPDGRVRMWTDDIPYTLSPDGNRMEQPGTEHWWVRE